MNPVVRQIRGALRHLGYDVVRYSPHHKSISRLSKLCGDYAIDNVIDVGANIGQFGQELIETGYRGKIVSLEPQSTAHQKLVAVAAGYAQWLVAERIALGSAPGNARINLSLNSVSSSLLPLLDRHIAADPDSKYIDCEAVPVTVLDDFIERTFQNGARLALKMDVQGYEYEILRGLDRNLHRINITLRCRFLGCTPAQRYSLIYISGS